MSTALPASGGTGSPAGVPSAAGRWLIYGITEGATGRQYVGLTAQTLEARFLGHRQTALRRKAARSGSLGQAILASLDAGTRYSDAFAIRELAVADSPEAACQLETDWIAALGCSAPEGFNLMPGGSSLGGLLNSVAVTVQDPTRGSIGYPSLSRAIQAVNERRTRAGEAYLDAGVVYARLKLDWTIEEALGLVAHDDGRGRRAAFIWQGRSYERLRDVARLSGIGVSTLRSRLQRRRQAGLRPDNDVVGDGRSGGARSKRGAEPLRFPSPDGDGTVSVDVFASRAGVAKSSVLHRHHQLKRSGRDPAAMPRSELLAFLTERQDRRIPLQLEVARGVVWRGGVRELIRRLFADHAVECRRPERILEPTIRARLRKTPGWPDRMTARDIRRAFGFEKP